MREGDSSGWRKMASASYAFSNYTATAYEGTNRCEKTVTAATATRADRFDVIISGAGLTLSVAALVFAGFLTAINIPF